MEMENNSFKSAIFGGFDREDVINYITRTSAESAARIEALESDIARLSEQEDKLRIQRDSADESNRRLTERLEKAEKDCAEASTALKDATGELETLRAELELAREEGSALRAENASLRSENNELRPLAEQYTAVKAHIAGIELDAHQRAEEYERGIHERLAAAIGECRAHCDTVLSSLSATCIRVTEELRRTENSVASLPSAFSALREGLDRLDESK